MTGIERLRALANGDASHETGNDWFLTAETLDAIVDQIERETLPRPRFEDGTVAINGNEFEAGGKRMVIYDMLVCTDGSYRILCEDQTVCVFEAKKPLKRPVAKVLDADGIEIKVGDEVWGVEDGEGPWTVVEINGDRVIGKLSSVLLVDIHCSKVTHKRPEPPDTWEKLAADIEDCDGTACDYFGKIDEEGRPICRECNAYNDDTDCTVLVMRDLVRRAKKLAGVD